MDTAAIGRRAKALRKARGWSLRVAAKETGLSVGTIFGLEAGKTWPHKKTVEAYAQTFGVSAIEFLNGKG